MNKYIDYIKMVGEGKAKEPLEGYLNPTLKKKKWYRKLVEIRKMNIRSRLDLIGEKTK